MKLTRQDFKIGAIDRMAVRRGLTETEVASLLARRAGLLDKQAAVLARHWFDQQYRHGGIAFRRAEYQQHIRAASRKQEAA